MDYVVEGLAFSIDVALFVVCAKQYHRHKNAVNMVQSAPYLPINKDLKTLVEEHSAGKLPYAAIRGPVTSLSSPIISLNNPNVNGVVQLFRIKEHVHQRTSTGFWSESQRIVQEVHNIVPFALSGNKMKVEVIDPLAAEVLDMDVISDVFSPSSPSFIDHIAGFFAGIRQRGVQSTEKMIREGAILTGVGEIRYFPEENTLKIQPPTNGAPYYLTNMQVSTLIKKLDSATQNYKMLCLLFGVAGIVIAGLIYRKYRKYRLDKEEEGKRSQLIEEARRRRRELARDIQNLPESQICVVCKSNPIEIILLPCGHVCLCENCSLDITSNCPVCRAAIQSRSVAFVA